MADTIRRRLSAPDEYLDDRLEGARRCAFRAAVRFELREAYLGRALPGWWLILEVNEAAAFGWLGKPTFGAAWLAAEQGAPGLGRWPLETRLLQAEQEIAKALLADARHDPERFQNDLLRTSVSKQTAVLELKPRFPA